MQQVIHIDEKWFYMNPETRQFYLLPKEENPYMCQQSKRYKIKAMFMAMIGKPLYDLIGNMLHDGKYGIFPFTYQQMAKKKSKNRDVGTLETKAVPHQIPRDEEFKAACTAHGFNIQLIFQPAQSQDLNSFPTKIEELIEKVYEAYEWFDPILNKYTWITLQSVMKMILEKEGGNNFNPPHMGKRKLDSLGQLPEFLEVERELIQQAVEHLNTLFIPIHQQHEEYLDTEVDAD
ncbi:uncharacterized protein LOC110692203 [Chenopodium quinoa]|uniref:uncharacterized protein LOC110692203 n=1 Tax=Chenopodium quinoa TaxID=63459 RepID=UPI000B76EF53|nr:uncharacterized protein LOC110692203 [Chenopodium quinoa]